MIPSNTIYVSQEGPANALALNKDCSQVVIAGRNVFKVFAIGENEFSEVCNLRVGKNLNLNFSSIDVAWSAIEENTIATAATNGAVVVWNLGRSGRSKQEHVFSDHKRTVNKVSFHLTEPHLLISGSQDGMMKCFDLRMKEVARTFMSNTESIRDVQFSPHAAHAFAAVSENGNVQVWDVRRHERCLHQFTAHSGPVFACDWHPSYSWLATASRDKTIKVWDMHGAKPNLEYTIYTIASVGHVKWRPQRKYQVSSCALVLDTAVQVWDVRRPHVPLATFAEHRDVTTAIAWLSSPDHFLSTSRDCTLYRHEWSSAAHPVLWANPQGVAVSARGCLAHAAPAAPLPPLRHLHAAAMPPPDRLVPGLGRKQPTAGSLSSTAQALLERVFPISSSCSLTVHRALNPHRQLLDCARRYKVLGDSTAVLAEHNASIARENNRHMVAHVWDVVATVYGWAGRADPAQGGTRTRGRPPPPPPQDPPPAHHHNAHPNHTPYSVVEEDSETMEEDSDSEWGGQFHLSGVLGMPTHSIYIPPSKRAKRATDDEAVWVSAASAHYVDVDAMDWTLPEEAFPLRHQPPLTDTAHSHIANQLAASSLEGSSGSSDTSSSNDARSETDNVIDHPHVHTHHTSFSTTESSTNGCGGCGTCGVCGTNALSVGDHVWPGRAHTPAFDTAPLLAAALRLHVDHGDIQTAATVILVLQEHRSDLTAYVDEAMQEEWVWWYVEVLQRMKEWNAAGLAARAAWQAGLPAPAHHASITLACARCGRRLKGHHPCERCSPRLQPFQCAVCQETVRGLYAWCQGCSHGGHLLHMKNWMDQHQLCPAGCGHLCQLG